MKKVSLLSPLLLYSWYQQLTLSTVLAENTKVQIIPAAESECPCKRARPATPAGKAALSVTTASFLRAANCAALVRTKFVGNKTF